MPEFRVIPWKKEPDGSRPIPGFSKLVEYSDAPDQVLEMFAGICEDSMAHQQTGKSDFMCPISSDDFPKAFPYLSRTLEAASQKVDNISFNFWVSKFKDDKIDEEVYVARAKLENLFLDIQCNANTILIRLQKGEEKDLNYYDKTQKGATYINKPYNIGNILVDVVNYQHSILEA